MTFEFNLPSEATSTSESASKSGTAPIATSTEAATATTTIASTEAATSSASESAAVTAGRLWLEALLVKRPAVLWHCGFLAEKCLGAKLERVCVKLRKSVIGVFKVVASKVATLESGRCPVANATRLECQCLLTRTFKPALGLHGQSDHYLWME